MCDKKMIIGDTTIIYNASVIYITHSVTVLYKYHSLTLKTVSKSE